MRGYASGMQKAAYVLGMSPATFKEITELVGLGALGAYPAYHLYDDIKNDKPMGEHLVELGGLGLLGAPNIMKLVKGR